MMEASFDLLSACLLILEFRFDTMLCSILGNENSNAGHAKFSRGPQVPHPSCASTFVNKKRNFVQFSTAAGSKIPQNI